jgi:GTP-binding protein HflX
VPSLLLLNKVDRLDEAARTGLRERFPGAILLSAHAPADVAALRQSMLDFFEAQMVEAELLIPYASQGRIGEVYENARVVTETFDEDGRRMRVRSMPGAIARLTRSFQA